MIYERKPGNRPFATMNTLFEPSMSTSRQSMMAAGPSMADQLPSTEFGFESLRERMSRFSMKFDGFIEQGRKRVLEERNEFRMNVAELQGATSLREGLRRERGYIAKGWDTEGLCST